MNLLVEGQPLLYPGVGIRRVMISLLHALGLLEGSPRVLIGGVASRFLEPGSSHGVDCIEFERRLDRKVPRWIRSKPERAFARKLWKRRRKRAARSEHRQALRLMPDAYWGVTPVPREQAWRAFPTIATVHDLHYLWDVPGMAPRDRSMVAARHPEYVARARHVVAVSEWTRQDVIRKLGVPAERVSVVPCAVGEEFTPCAPDLDRAAHRRRLRLPERYLLHVGTVQPRKNLARLVRAHGALRDRGHDLDLVLCGQDAWLADEIFDAVSKSKSGARVHFRDDIDDRNLVTVYNLAEVFVIPSLLEGFGIPALEAMACGTPVVASTAAALPEVVGDAAILVDPEDEGGIADAVEEILGSSEKRAAMRTLGLLRASQFSWRSSAGKLANIFAGVRDTAN